MRDDSPAALIACRYLEVVAVFASGRMFTTAPMSSPPALPPYPPLPPAASYAPALSPRPTEDEIPPPPLPETTLAEAAYNSADAPSFESRIGLQWLNRVAVVTLVIGVAFFFFRGMDGLATRSEIEALWATVVEGVKFQKQLNDSGHKHDLNPHYKYMVCEWPYIRPYLADDFDTPNARSIRDRSFNLYLNEKYGEQESRDCVKAIVKVEKPPDL